MTNVKSLSATKSFTTREIARKVRAYNNYVLQQSGITTSFRDAVRTKDGWQVGNLKHNDKLGTLSLRK